MCVWGFLHGQSNSPCEPILRQNRPTPKGFPVPVEFAGNDVVGEDVAIDVSIVLVDDGGRAEIEWDEDNEEDLLLLFFFFDLDVDVVVPAVVVEVAEVVDGGWVGEAGLLSFGRYSRSGGIRRGRGSDAFAVFVGHSVMSFLFTRVDKSRSTATFFNKSFISD